VEPTLEEEEPVELGEQVGRYGTPSKYIEEN
jgi:hypothetical protein